MRGEILSEHNESNDDQRRPDELGDRLDSVIGETSSGMGALISELIRRSLKSGVSDIGQSLGLFAEEKVEVAIQQQMPAIAEAADEVAESTSKRVVKAVADELTEKAEKQKQETEAKIQEVGSSAFDRSRSHVAEVVSQVRQSITETQAMASDHQEASNQKLEELQQKGRKTWQKIKDELEVLRTTHRKSQEELALLDRARRQLHEENTQLKDELRQVRQQAEQQSEENARLRSQHEVFEERLAKLEQPKGLRALFAKMGGGSKKGPEANLGE